jgi:hypothetical protein
MLKKSPINAFSGNEQTIFAAGLDTGCRGRKKPVNGDKFNSLEMNEISW